MRQKNNSSAQDNSFFAHFIIFCFSHFQVNFVIFNMADKRTKKRARKFLRLLQQQLSLQLSTVAHNDDWIEARFQTAIDSLPESETQLKEALLSRKSRHIRLLRKQVFAKETKSFPPTNKAPRPISTSPPAKKFRRSLGVTVSKLVDDHQCSINAVKNYLEYISSFPLSAAEPKIDLAEQFLSNIQVRLLTWYLHILTM